MARRARREKGEGLKRGTKITYRTASLRAISCVWVRGAAQQKGAISLRRLAISEA